MRKLAKKIDKKIYLKNMKYIYLLIFAFFISCNPYSKTIDEKLNGSWAIEEMKYQNLNYKDSLLINTLFFEDNNFISLPDTFGYEKENVKYELENGNKIFITINSKNSIYNERFEVKFIKNEQKKLLGIDLISKNTSIKAYKFLQNYEVDGIGW